MFVIFPQKKVWSPCYREFERKLTFCNIIRRIKKNTYTSCITSNKSLTWIFIQNNHIKIWQSMNENIWMMLMIWMIFRVSYKRRWSCMCWRYTGLSSQQCAILRPRKQCHYPASKLWPAGGKPPPPPGIRTLIALKGRRTHRFYCFKTLRRHYDGEQKGWKIYKKLWKSTKYSSIGRANRQKLRQHSIAWRSFWQLARPMKLLHIIIEAC